MKDAIWDREPDTRDKLLAKAHKHRLKDLRTDLDNKCPVKALSHYVKHNWHRMHSAQRKAEGLPFVSARAEAQVRDRSKKRFNVACAWKLDNLESLAVRTLHAGMKLGPVPVPVPVSSVIPTPMPRPPTTSLWPLASARVPRPAPHVPQPTDAAPPALAGNVCEQMDPRS